MSKPNPLKTNLSLKIISLIENNVSKPYNIRKELNKELSDNEIREQNFTQKLKKLKNAKLISRKGKNKGSQLKINYPGIIEFMFKEFFNYGTEDLEELNFNDKLLIFLIEDYLKNSCVTTEEIHDLEKLKQSNKDILVSYDNWDIQNQTIYSILERFIFGFGKAQDLAFRRETYYDKTHKTLKLENIETFETFREEALNYYHKKSDNPYTKYISGKIYEINRIIADSSKEDENLSLKDIEEAIDKDFEED